MKSKSETKPLFQHCRKFHLKFRRKWTAKVQEMQDAFEAAEKRVQAAEKTRSRLQADLEDAQVHYSPLKRAFEKLKLQVLRWKPNVGPTSLRRPKRK